MLDPTFGFANYVLRSLSIPSQNFLQSSDQALLIISLLSVWKGAGYYAIFYLAALQDVPENLVEAAKIDGANAWQRFFNVTLPQIAPISLFVVIMASIGSLKGFDQFYIMTKGGPARSTTTIMMYFYEHAFAYMDIGYGASIAIMFTLMVFVFVIIQRFFLSKMKGAS
jgi:multiple sugar transport system permease protein